ncbi:class I SAM-dependent methyltransferase [Amylibacter sp. SFDW26]|uniref:class I SAM-dependent methyltransferase n=1 Tax=Amylibacter sp. SFDW26 TaxID=2652722 RepID=UPI001262092C|nr:class I SAM-dependent methyltransferase [Amylibacter sp. SFDW26]KAB7610080.1 class I SAM-dependent methyltransferase [Amylibacter sp. SFDW26]
MKCRHCKAELELEFLDLGNAPPSNAYLKPEDLRKPETTYPLRILTCTECWLVQTEDYTDADDLFREDYAYFSSTSKGWLKHAAEYCEMITKRLGLTKDSFVVELASNDGYLLKNFVAAGIPCLGVEPTKSTAEAARALGVPVRQEFFGEAFGAEMAATGEKADLVLGNNVYAHVPDINDFTQGVAAILKPNGVVTFEFPHVMQLIKQNQFDTVYHEHFSYLSLCAVHSIFAKAGLRIFDVETLPTHGGSLRVYGCLVDANHGASDNVEQVLNAETDAGLQEEETYKTFQAKADAVKDGLVRFLLDAKEQGKSVAGYGAAAKGNTLMNYAGIRPDLMPFVCDAADAKIGQYLPASHIPIFDPKVLREQRPDYLVILPWNIAQEVMTQNADLAEAGTQFVTAVPELKIV